MPNALEAWHRFVAEKQPGILRELIADEAVFHSPVVFRPQEGKAVTIKYLEAAGKVLGNEAFRYVGEWTGPNSAVLEFLTEIEGIAIDGADFITWNDAGKIVDFKVMIRPLKAINIVMAKMGDELSRTGA